MGIGRLDRKVASQLKSGFPGDLRRSRALNLAPVRPGGALSVANVISIPDVVPYERERALLAAAEAAAQRLASVLENISDGFIALDRNWRYVALNDHACESMGLRREDILGRSIWDLYPDVIGTHFETQVRRVHTNRQATCFEFFYPSRNRWYENRVYPSGEGLSMLFAEVTQRKLAEQALIASEKRLQTDLRLMKRLQEVSTRLVRDADANPPLLEIVDAAIQITGADMGDIQLFNPDEQALEIAASRGFDQPFLEFFNAVHAGHDTACGWAIQSGTRVVIDDITTSTVFQGTQALEVLLAARVRAMQSTPLLSRSGELLGVLSTHYRVPRAPDERDLQLLDVLARQAADWIERTHAREQLRDVNETLAKADQRKDEFLAMLAHELRNPLASIMAGSEVLRLLRPEAPEAQEAREMIENEARQLSRLVDDLLDVSRITAGRITLRSEPLDLRNPVNRAVESLRPLFEDRWQQLQVQSSDEEIRVEGDAARLVQVFSNLLRNAAKFTHVGGTVCLTVGRLGGQAVVRVQDNGRGIASEDLPRIFNAFESVEDARNRDGGGLGIGLPLSRKLVHLHEGTLRAFSRGRGRGSEFVVRLPLLRALQSEEAATVACERPHRLAPRLRILLVDDNESFSAAMMSLLRAMGHEAHAIHSGELAIAAIRELRPKIVLLDIDLPGMRGDDVARAIKADAGLGNILLIALTGFGQERDRVQTRLAGFDHHLTKPVDANVLQQLIDAALADAQCPG